MVNKLASINFFWKWISRTEGENDEMGIQNSRDKIAIELDFSWSKMDEVAYYE